MDIDERPSDAEENLDR